MKIINIKGEKDSPSILIDTENRIFRIMGASFAENPYAVYSHIFKWIENEAPQLDQELKCEFYYTYINSSTKKILYEIFTIFEDLRVEGMKIHIDWWYDEFDDDMLELGHEFAELIDLPFNYIPVAERK